MMSATVRARGTRNLRTGTVKAPAYRPAFTATSPFAAPGTRASPGTRVPDASASIHNIIITNIIITAGPCRRAATRCPSRRGGAVQPTRAAPRRPAAYNGKEAGRTPVGRRMSEPRGDLGIRSRARARAVEALPMSQNLFRQTIVAVIWDFDKTLIPGYMQAPLFRHYGVNEEKFWREVGGLPEFYKKRGLELVSRDTLYLTHILTYVRSGRFKGSATSCSGTSAQRSSSTPDCPSSSPPSKSMSPGSRSTVKPRSAWSTISSASGSGR